MFLEGDGREVLRYLSSRAQPSIEHKSLKWTMPAAILILWMDRRDAVSVKCRVAKFMIAISPWRCGESSP